MGQKLSLQVGQIINNYEILEIKLQKDCPWKSHENGAVVKCVQCGETFLLRFSQIKNIPHKCGYIGGRGHTDIVKGMRFGYLTTTGNIKPHKSPSGIFSTYVEVQCDCGSKPFYVAKKHLKGQSHSRTISCGCKSISSGEIKLIQILDDLSINYKTQHIIPELSSFMKFDFAIFNNNDLLIALIEYDGKQHFQAVDHFGGEEQFSIQQERDKRKNRYCEENNIRLIRIPYTDYNILNREYLISKIPEIQNEIKLSGNSDQA